jgi:shikimate kinase/3-dehydroquinate synthase
MTRADHVVALGGGVVGDLAGFCAATYQRGVPVVHVPTTLVAQVDSAYGGKTGVDLPAAKNYIGAYHQPAAVLVDPDTLSTLPAPELAAGWVEVLKTALIAGGQLWERVSAAPGCEVDERTIRDCAHTKLAIVAADERDAGARQTLNLGHTVGHAIETVTGYTRYRHGEAVGLGLLAALRLSGADDLRAQVRELLQARDLPVTLGGARARARAGDGASVDVDQIVATIARDKKRVGPGGVPFVLLCTPGKPRIGREVSDDALRAAVTELTAS